MNFDDKIEEIKVLGALGYSPDQIADAFELTTKDRLALSLRLESINDPLSIAYRSGFVNAEMSVDIVIQKRAENGDDKAIKIQGERSRERKIRTLKEKLFGI